MELNYPKICVQKSGIVYIHFILKNKRYRLFNGKRIGLDIEPNRFPQNLRYDQAKLLCAEVYKYLSSGGVLVEFNSETLINGKLTDKQYLEKALRIKLREKYTKNYKNELKYAYENLIKISRNETYNKEDILKTLELYKNNSSHNSLLKNLKVLFNKAVELGLNNNPTTGIKRKKTNATLNKPIKDISLVLEEIRAFDYNLYLCCLLTYGCLLRPHREVRELTWNDFSIDLKQINLSGARNKSGRNRIVPVPRYISELLSRGEPRHNIFSNTKKPFNESYFKTLWGRFKKVSNLLEQDQTLYSFRHSGAIEIYNRTGSLSKLQKAMGHSSLTVSLTYLRGLEVAELKESDMPMI